MGHLRFANLNDLILFICDVVRMDLENAICEHSL